jgi:hypothetical protein
MYMLNLVIMFVAPCDAILASNHMRSVSSICSVVAESMFASLAFQACCCEHGVRAGVL